MQIVSVVPFWGARIQLRILHFILLSYLLTLLHFGIILQSLSLMTLSTLKHTSQLFCRMSLNLGLSYFSHLESIFNKQASNEACLTDLGITDQYQPNVCSSL